MLRSTTLLLAASTLAPAMVARAVQAQDQYTGPTIPVNPNQAVSAGPSHSNSRFGFLRNTAPTGWTAMYNSKVERIPEFPLTPTTSGLYRVYVDVMVDFRGVPPPGQFCIAGPP